MMCFSVDALAGAAASEQAERRPFRDVERHVVEHLAAVERLRHVFSVIAAGAIIGPHRDT